MYQCPLGHTSEIFRWYERDFGGKRGVIDFIFDYLADEKAVPVFPT
jgi:hypothetical protein